MTPPVLPVPEDEFDPSFNLMARKHQPHEHAIFTRLGSGLRVHPIGNSLEYALSLLRADDPAGFARASAILETAATYQQADAGSPDYGIWPWLVEEPLKAMPVTDTNTACFFGALLAMALKHHAACLTNSARRAAFSALERAAEGILRRPIRPEYTNIALLGAAAAAPAGELLGRPDFLEHARLRLDETTRSVAHHGGFAEYNSPAYTPVAIGALEKILYTTEDADLRRRAMALMDAGWQVAAEHYHVATRQWAGPISRTYQDLPDLHFLRQRCPVSDADASNAPPWAQPVPERWADRFCRPVSAAVTIKRLLINRVPPQTPAYGTTWMDAVACLGTVTLDNTTYQRRPLLGYWMVPGASQPAVLRLRVLRDGHDFASAVLRCAQDGSRVLAAVSFAGNLGDVQHVADRPAQPVFTTSRLVVRVQLQAEGAQVERTGGRFVLTAGGHGVVVQPIPARVFDRPVVWTPGQEKDLVWVEGVLFDSLPPAPLDVRTAAEAAGVALELVALQALSGCSAGEPPIRLPSGFAWPAAGLELRAPAFAEYAE